jgi:hypothetical protein
MAAPKIAITLDTSRVRKGVILGVESGDTGSGPQTREIVTGIGPEGVLLAVQTQPKRLVIPLPSAASSSAAPPSVTQAETLHAPANAPDAVLEGSSTELRVLSDAELTALATKSLIDDAMSGTARAAAEPQGPKLVIPTVRVESSSSGEPEARAVTRDVDTELRDRLFRPDQQRVRGTGQSRGAPLLSRASRPAPAAPDAASDRERLLSDMHSRADDLDVDSARYEAIPIEAFGAAALRGMGVAEAVISADSGVGAASAGPRPRPHGLGLGAELAPQMEAGATRRPVRPGDAMPASSGTAPAAVAAAAAAAASRKFPGVVMGAVVQVMRGRWTAKLGIVVAAEGVPGLDMARVRVVAPGRASFAVGAAAASAPAAAQGAPVLTEADTEVTVVPKRDLRAVTAAELAAGGLGEQATDHIALLQSAGQ